MKIPELPGSYRPGDVVNGHVLTERGHWVELGNDRAAGLRRRYLSTQVSTIRDPDKPSSELTSAQHHATAHAASDSAHAPTQSPTASSSASAASSSAPPAARGPHAGPQPPRGPAPGGPVPGGPAQTGTPAPSVKRSCFGCLGVVVIALVIISVIVGAIVSQVSDDAVEFDLPSSWQDADDAGPIAAEPEEDAYDDDPEPLPYRLTTDEVDLVELADWEFWEAEFTSLYLLTVEAPALYRERADLTIELTATDADGVTYELREHTSLHWGDPVLIVGHFPEQPESEIVSIEMTAVSGFGPSDVPDYEAWVEDFEIEARPLRPLLTVQIGAAGEGSSTITRFTAVVRNADGDIVNIGTGFPPAPEPGLTVEAEVFLWGSHVMGADDSVEFSLVTR